MRLIAVVLTTVSLGLACLGSSMTSGEVQAASDSCREVHIEVAATATGRDRITIDLRVTNAGSAAVFLLDDNFVASAFQVRDGLLWYDRSTDFYLSRADVILSAEAEPDHVETVRLRPGESVHRKLQWKPRNQRERGTPIREVAVRLSFAPELADGKGQEFVRQFAKQPSACTTERRVVLSR